MQRTTTRPQSGLLTAAASLIGATLLIGVATQLMALGGGGDGQIVAIAQPVAGAPPPALAPAVAPAVLTNLGQPSPVSVSATLDRAAVMVGEPGIVKVLLTLEGEEPRGAVARMPTDLVVLLDASSSMSGDKIIHAREAVAGLVGRLGADDRFGLIRYSDFAQVEVPLSLARAEARPGWLRQVASVEAQGSTNIAHALDLAVATVSMAREPGRAPRVILISDGVATAGDTSDAGLTRRARQVSLGEYVLSSVGVGEGFNEDLMTSLADVGAGNFYYLDSSAGLAKVFEGEFAAARQTVASAVQVHLSTPPGTQLVDAGGYPFQRDGARSTFTPGAMFSGQRREIWLTYRVQASEVGPQPLGGVAVDYVGDNGQRSTAASLQLADVQCVAQQQEFVAAVNTQVWERSVAQDDLSQLKLDVATALKQGDRGAAEQHINSYEQLNTAMNSAVGSSQVQQALDQLGALRQDVSDAFSGEDQEHNRAALSKSYKASGYDGRRAGSKMSLR